VLETLIDCDEAPLLELNDLQGLMLSFHASQMMRRMMQQAKEWYFMHAIEIE
jgi:hypothetical protein